MNTDDLLRRVDAALPIDDIVGWLLQEYPGATEPEVMLLLQKVYQHDYRIDPAASEQRNYRVGDKDWNAFPQRVSAAREA